MYKILRAGILILLFFLFADDARAFTISPTRYLVTADPGTAQTVQLSIKNDEGENKKFIIFVEGLEQTGNGSLIFQKDLDVAESWVQASQSSITLAPNAITKINFVISVPKNTLPGSHYLGLAAEMVPEKADTSVVSSRLFAILTLRVAGEVNESVSVEKWSGPAVTWKRDWPLVLQLQNNGNIDVPLKSEIIVRYQGKALQTNDWILGNNLLIKSSRFLEKTISPPLFWPGRYEIQNKIYYGRSGQVVWGMNYVWYFPLWSIVTGIVVLFVIIFIYIKIRRRHVKI